MLRASCTTRRYNSTEAAAANPKIDDIVDQISKLTLLETADLVSSLKVNALNSTESTAAYPIAHDRTSN
jgi:ribosomal protein L7/L12